MFDPSPRPLAFVDLETTGATAATDRITEIGIVTVEADGSVQEWQQLINPGIPIPPFIEQLTGISDAMVADAPPFAAVAEDIRSRLAGRLFIAHNARFDYGFLKAEFKRLGLLFRAPVLCTVKLSRQLFPEHKRHNLDSLIERHGLHAHGRHRALADAQLIHQFWERAHENPGPAAVQGALRALNTHPSLPPQLDAGLVDDLPDGPGVYLFYGEEDRPLLVAKARNLRKGILGHFAGDFAAAGENDLVRLVRRVEWQEAAGDIGAQLREAALVKALQPSHNRPSRREGETCTWTLVEKGDGWLQPVLAYARDLDFRLQGACYGLFRNPREAREVLAALAAEHKLCDSLLGLEETAPGQACSGHGAKRCKGACIGREAPARHTMRLVAALVRLKLQPWPLSGPALIREGEEAHVVDGWRYLGSASQDGEIARLLAAPRPAFAQDIYKILVKAAARLEPVPLISEASPAGRSTA